MNKMYKTVWNKSTGQWAVVSELAKSNGKNKSILSHASVALAVAFMGTGGALAQTFSGNHGSTSHTLSGATLVELQNYTSNTTKANNFQIQSSAGNAVTVNVSNSNLTTNSSDLINHPFNFGITGDQGVTVHFTGNNSLTLNGGRTDTAVLASATHGNSSIIVDGVLNITNHGNFQTFELDALEANSSGTGRSTIAHTGEGRIQTAGGNAIFARNSGSGGAEVTLRNAAGKDRVELVTTGAGSTNNGIRAQSINGTSSATGSVTIDTNARISSSGAGANAIFASTDHGNITITNDGTLSATGAGSHGIIAQSIDGGIHISNTGSITATGGSGTGKGVGILAQTTGAPVVIFDINTTPLVHNVATIGLQGEGGSVSIQSNSEINATYTANGSTSMRGLDAIARDAVGGSAYVNYDGTASHGVTMEGKISSGSMIGVRASSENVLADAASTARVDAKGNVSVTLQSGSNASLIYGIEAITQGAGDATVNYSNGKISLKNTGATMTGVTVSPGHVYHGVGILAWSSLGNGTGNAYATATADTTIETTGHHLWAVFGQSKGDTTKVVDLKIDSTIKTDGVSSYGIFASALDGAKLNIESKANIETKQSGSYAIYAHVQNSGAANAGVKINHENGTITTADTSSHGIYALTNAASGDIDVTLKNANVDLKGYNSDGIGVFQTSTLVTTDTDIKITTVGGSITTQNTTSAGDIGWNYGIVAYQLGDSRGDVVIDNQGTTVTTKKGSNNTGKQSDAINASLNGATATGKVSITNTGVLSTDGTLSAGIRAVNNGSGDTEVKNYQAISTDGEGSHGISTSSASGKTTIISSGTGYTIKTNGMDAKGIFATSTDGGRIEIGNTVGITTNDSTAVAGTTRSHAIYAAQTSAGSGNGIRIEQVGSTISTKGYDASGVRAFTWANSGDVDLYVERSTINVDGINGDGVFAQKSVAVSTDASDLDLNVTVKDSKINVLQAPSMAGNGNANFGIVGIQQGAAQGHINIVNSNTDINIGAGQSGTTTTSAAIYTIYRDSGATGSINIQNDGTLSSKADGAFGVIHASNAGSGNVDVLNLGNILADGDGSYGIQAESKNGGNVKVENHANIDISKATHASSIAIGIAALANGGGDAEVNASGNINVLGNSSTVAKGAMVGIEARADQGNTVVNFQGGKILTYASAITAWDQASGLGKRSQINIGPNAYLASSEDFAIRAWMAGGNKVNIDASSRIEGQRGIDVNASSPTAYNEINNHGVIDVGDDIAIKDDSVAGVETVINNWGTIIGQMKFGAAKVVFNNYSPNSLEMRNFIDTTGDGVRDSQSVAVVDFGGGNTTFNNDTTGAMRMTPVPLNSIAIDATGEYVPFGAKSINEAGILQGQVIGLSEFTNSGKIEMSNNRIAGDVIVITGGTTPGSYGGGNYTANAGSSLHLDSVINMGGALSLSDILVLDDVTVGTGATQVYINPVFGSYGGLTMGDGIKIIEGLGSQNPGAFVLAQELSYGAYEYQLGLGAGANAKNWYLKNNQFGKPFYSAVAGGYLANQHAAATMFNHNILDRRDNVRSPDQTVWGRMNYSSTDADLFNDGGNAKIKTSLFQFGADLYKKDGFVAGLFAGYGSSNMDYKTRFTGRKADGKVTGYQVGAYASWMPQGEGQGLFVDVWGHYARYSNKLNGSSLYNKGKYNSNGFALSGEVGYGFEFAKQGDGQSWIIEPHAQVIYSHLKANDYTDLSGNDYHGNKASGVQTRVGARLYMRRAGGDDGIVPFAEANWLGNFMSNSIKIDHGKAKSDIGKNALELKLGLQGKVSNKMSIWGHIGARKGSEGYKGYDAQVGLGYEW